MKNRSNIISIEDFSVMVHVARTSSVIELGKPNLTSNFLYPYTVGQRSREQELELLRSILKTAPENAFLTIRESWFYGIVSKKYVLNWDGEWEKTSEHYSDCENLQLKPMPLLPE